MAAPQAPTDDLACVDAVTSTGVGHCSEVYTAAAISGPFLLTMLLRTPHNTSALFPSLIPSAEEQVNAPLIVIRDRGRAIATAELVYEVGQVTVAMERLYDDSLGLDPKFQSSKKIAELNDTLTSNIRKQQLGGANGSKQFVKLCTTDMQALVSSTKDAIQQDWQTMTNP